MFGWLKSAALAIFAIFAPVHTVMATVGALICIDLISGIMAARKRKEPVTSAALRRTLSKMIIYQIAVISGFLAEHYMLGDSLPIVKLIAATIGLVEMKSILENLNDINGAPLFASIISSLGSKNDKEEEKK